MVQVGSPKGSPIALLVSGRATPTSAPLVPGPTVGGIDLDLVEAKDEVEVDGDRAQVEVKGVQRVDVVTSFLERADGRVLLLRRSDKVGSFRGRWAGVSGFLEDASPLEQAQREIQEETGVGVTALTLVATAPPVFARDGQRAFAVHPFRFRVHDPAVRLDWEHSEFEWVDPEEIAGRSTVPRLAEVWRVVATRSPSDSAGGSAGSKR